MRNWIAVTENNKNHCKKLSVVILKHFLFMLRLKKIEMVISKTIIGIALHGVATGH